MGEGKGSRGPFGGRVILLLLGPSLLLLFVLFLLPMAIMGGYAFLTPGAQGGATLPVTGENFLRTLDPIYLGILWRSLRLAFLTTLLCLLLGFPAAWVLRGMRGRARDLALLAIILPAWTNLLVKNYAWIVILRREGLANRILIELGVITEPLPLLFNEGAVLVGLVHTFLPFMILPLYASLEKLDPALLEAARDLGAGWWARLTRIVIPQCGAGIAAGAILVFVPTLGSFVTPDLLGGARGMMVGNLVQNQILLTRDWPFGSALSLWLTAVSLLLIVLSLRLTGQDAGEEGR